MWIIDRIRNINWRLVAAALCAVGILHILATLATPDLANSHAFEALAQDLPMNTMQVLPPVAPGAQRIPFMGPDARYAICRFDTADGQVSLTARLPGPGWMIALYSTDGDNFFASVAQPGRRTDVQLLLVPSDDRFKGLAAETKSETEDEPATLTVAAQAGIAVLRAPDQGQAYAARNLAELKRARCSYKRT